MKLEDSVKLNMLYDTYGKLLTKSQSDIMELYLAMNLTLSEIAETLGITRQAVLDQVKKAEKKLEGYEEMLGFLNKKQKLSNFALSLDKDAQRVLLSIIEED